MKMMVQKISQWGILFLIVSAFSTALAQEAVKTVSDYIVSGWDLVEKGELTQAIKDFQEAVKLEPENVKAYEALGQTYLFLDSYKESEKVFNRVLKLDPQNTAAKIGLAKVYSYTNRMKKSIESYQDVLEIDPRNQEALKGLAQVYSWSGQNQESISQYEKVLGEDPRNTKVYKELAQVYRWDNRLADAENIYRKVLDSNPSDPDARLALAQVYEQMGRFDMAKLEYRKVLSTDPNNQKAQEGLNAVLMEDKPLQEAIFKFIRERDAADFRASSFSYGYKYTNLLDQGNNIYGAYYLHDLRQTGYEHMMGNVFELGGKYNVNNWLALFGATDLRTYNNDPDFFVGGNIDARINYMGRNTLDFKYQRDLTDVLDNIRGNHYGIESNVYLNSLFLLTNAYNLTSYSDSNASQDWYHNLTFMALKNKPVDLNLGVGFRHRNFDTTSTQYYSPQDFDSMIYSLFIGRQLTKSYIYGMFKFNDNSDHVDSFYYVLGNSYPMNKNVSFISEVNYFDTEEKYGALTINLSLRFRF